MDGAVELMMKTYHALIVLVFLLGVVLIWVKSQPIEPSYPIFKLIGWSVVCERPYDIWFCRIVGFIILIPATPIIAFIINCLLTAAFAIVWFIYTNSHLVFEDIGRWAGFVK